jgi:gliding motility-associated-like protein
MKKLSKQNFDEIIKNRFQNYEAVPPENIFHNLKQTFKDNPGNSGLNNFFNNNKWILSAVAVVIISGIVAFTLVNSNNNGIIKNDTNNNLLLANNINHLSSDNNSQEINNEIIANETIVTEDLNKISDNIVNTQTETSEIETNDEKSSTNNVHNSIKANAGSDITLCGLQYNLHAILSNKKSSGTWKANGNKNAVFTNCKNPISIVQVKTYGKYQFIWTENNEKYLDKDTVVIEFIESKGIQLNYHVIAATCKNNNGIIELFPQESGTYRYFWQDETEASESYRYNLISGVYNVKIVDEQQCEENVSVTVNDSGIVTAGFYHQELSLNIDVPIYFSNTSKIDGENNNENNDVIFKWYFGDGTSSIDENPEKIYTSHGSFSVKLIVSSTPGCVDSAEIDNIKIDDEEFKAANIFTPNGDGLNDVFIAKAKMLENFKGYIINRSGKILFEWNDPEKGWDGKLIGGNYATPGVYYYIIQGIDKSGKQCQYKNFFHLNR